MSERLNVLVEDGTKAKMLAMAEGERKLGELISRLIDEEYTRQTVSLEALAERVEDLEESLGNLPDLQWFENKLTDLQPMIDQFQESYSELPDLQWLENKLAELQPMIDQFQESSGDLFE